jgi:integrase
MARTPQPWYWKPRRVWCVQIAGRRHRLTEPGEKAQTRPAAYSAFHTLMAQAAQATKTTLPTQAAEPDPPFTTGALVAAFLAEMNARARRDEVSRQAPADCRRRLAGFAQRFGDLLPEQVTPAAVAKWAAGRAGWGPTMRHDAVGTVKAMFRWGAVEGLVSPSPVALMRKPSRVERREHVLDDGQAQAILAAILVPGFRDFVLFLWLTGCRPGEAARLAAADVDWGRAIVVLRRHKTAKRSGRARTIRVPWPALLVLARQPAAGGPVFRTGAGKPWGRSAWNSHIRRLRARTGLGKEAFTYAFRHLFATTYLEQTGGDLAGAAALLGHSSTAMVSRVYSHLDQRDAYLRGRLDGLDRKPGEDG